MGAGQAQVLDNGFGLSYKSSIYGQSTRSIRLGQLKIMLCEY